MSDERRDYLMGTRADLYTGGTAPASMVWLGSVAWDGYPDGLPEVAGALDEDAYVSAVATVLSTRADATRPEQGWPWPWPDSATTDYAYTWTPAGVLISSFGKPWFLAADEDATPVCEASFPNMTAIQNIAWDQRSGLLFLQVDDPGSS